jgi:hypothetical protein
VGKKRLPYYLPYAAVILFLILPFIWILLSKYNNTPVDNLSEKIAEATEKHSPSTPETSKIETQETHSKVKFHHQAKVQKAGFEKSKDVSELGQNAEKVKQYSVDIAEIPSKITFLPLDMNFPESMIPIDENFQVVKADLPQERHITNFESISSFFLVKVLGQKDAQVRLEKVKKSETNQADVVVESSDGFQHWLEQAASQPLQPGLSDAVQEYDQRQQAGAKGWATVRPAPRPQVNVPGSNTLPHEA